MTLPSLRHIPAVPSSCHSSEQVKSTKKEQPVHKASSAAHKTALRNTLQQLTKFIADNEFYSAHTQSDQSIASGN
jgi:hypothetical protein